MYLNISFIISFRMGRGVDGCRCRTDPRVICDSNIVEGGLLTHSTFFVNGALIKWEPLRIVPFISCTKPSRMVFLLYDYTIKMEYIQVVVGGCAVRARGVRGVPSLGLFYVYGQVYIMQ